MSFDTVSQPSTKILKTAYSQILLHPFDFGFFYSVFTVSAVSQKPWTTKTIRIRNIICSVWGTYVHPRLFEQNTKDFGSKVIHF